MLSAGGSRKAERPFKFATLAICGFALVASIAPSVALAQGGQEDVQAPVKQFPKVVAAEVTTANGAVNGSVVSTTNHIAQTLVTVVRAKA